MNLGRRWFLKSLAAATAAVGAGFDVDPERLLWVPGRKTFFLPEKKLVADPAEVRQAFHDIQQRPIDDVLAEDQGIERFWMNRYTRATSVEPRHGDDWFDVEIDRGLIVF
jgi:hypothetical protein